MEFREFKENREFREIWSSVIPGRALARHR
jgi:hypothetical protein